ncbi:MAG TPA: SDR family NAD(P)-dependent oxidoreductase [Acidimicrobiales bacterium]|nr:SDR family NAD(P)-dependent oxidoreductase [Acidimicrobiales bacterium]
MSMPTPAGRVVVVTGASDGIGAAVVRALKGRGDQVVVVGRSPAKTRAVAAELGAEGHVADFAHLGEVRALASELGRQHSRVDVLVNNAGLIAGARRTLTDDGHELSFQVNHLAPFLLTMLLRPQLSTGGATVVTTSSRAGAARDARVVLEDLNMDDGYDALRAYKATKLANVLFTRELARRWATNGVSAAAAHPGMVRTRWGLTGPAAVRAVVRSPFRLLMRSPGQGARTIVWLATTQPGEDWASGGYFADCKPAKASPLADDRQLAKGLWERSESLCGL